MRRIKVLKAGEVEVDRYQPHSFTQNQNTSNGIDILDRLTMMSSKKAIKKIAKKSGLRYDDDKISFATEVINRMLNEMDNEK